VSAPFDTIAIVGVGLIGSSVARACRERWPSIQCLGIDRVDPLDALRLGVIDRASTRLEDAAEADLVVLAAPVLQNVALLERLAPHVTAGCVVTDVGSTKRSIVDVARRLDGLAFVGGHPLAGAEVSGVTSGRADLFRNRPWVLTPDTGTDEEVLRRVTGLVEGLGAEPVMLDADEHDRLLAYVSHLPQLVASTLLQMVGEAVGRSGLRLSGAGLGDTTRLAASPASVWTEICHTNADELGAALDRLCECLATVRGELSMPDRMETLFESAARWRGILP
jgi:prephenate dehydrogenase